MRRICRDENYSSYARPQTRTEFYLTWANHNTKTAWEIRRSHKLEVIWPESVDLPTFT